MPSTRGSGRSAWRAPVSTTCFSNIPVRCLRPRNPPAAGRGGPSGNRAAGHGASSGRPRMPRPQGPGNRRIKRRHRRRRPGPFPRKPRARRNRPRRAEPPATATGTNGRPAVKLKGRGRRPRSGPSKPGRTKPRHDGRSRRYLVSLPQVLAHHPPHADVDPVRSRSAADLAGDLRSAVLALRPDGRVSRHELPGLPGAGYRGDDRAVRFVVVGSEFLAGNHLRDDRENGGGGCLGREYRDERPQSPVVVGDRVRHGARVREPVQRHCAQVTPGRASRGRGQHDDASADVLHLGVYPQGVYAWVDRRDRLGQSGSLQRGSRTHVVDGTTLGRRFRSCDRGRRGVLRRLAGMVHVALYARTDVGRIMAPVWSTTLRPDTMIGQPLEKTDRDRATMRDHKTLRGSVIFCRHGATDYHPDRFYEEGDGPSLSPEGSAQAEALGRWFARGPVPVEAVYVSPTLRTRQTVAPVERVLDVHATPCPELAERTMGRWNGRLVDEVKRGSLEDWNRWKADPLGFAPPEGGESLAAFGHRVQRAMDDLLNQHPG